MPAKHLHQCTNCSLFVVVTLSCAMSVGKACHHCGKYIGKDTVTKCSVCETSIHLSCLINKFGLSTNACTVQWLSDFLTAGNFQFVCKTCIEGKQFTSKKDAAQGFTAELTKL
jgi:hypothetical protein